MTLYYPWKETTQTFFLQRFKFNECRGNSIAVLKYGKTLNNIQASATLHELGIYNHFFLFGKWINGLILRTGEKRKAKSLHKCNCAMCWCLTSMIRQEDILYKQSFMLWCVRLSLRVDWCVNIVQLLQHKHTKKLTFCQNRLVYNIPAHYTFSIMTKYALDIITFSGIQG